MAQDVAVAGLASPLTSTQDPAAGLISEAGAAVKQFRAGSLEDRVQEAASTAAELADETRTDVVARQGALSSAGQENAALFQAAEGLTAQELLSARQQEVSKDAERIFGKYRRALGQGATNAQAARIAVEKEMQDLISSNPAFSDVIRTSAARALGQTEFQVLTSGVPVADKQNQSQFAKDRSALLDAVDQQAALQGWSETYKASRTRSALLDLSRKYQIENSNQFFEQTETFDANTADMKSSQIREKATIRANELITNGLDAIDQNGGTAEGLPMLGEQQLAQIRVNVQSEMQSLRVELENTFPDTLSPERRNALVSESLAPLQEVMTVLNSNRASEVLQGVRQAQQLGSELTFAQLLPFTMGMSDAFGQNYEAVVSKFEPGRLAELAFWNAAPVELQEMVRSGDMKRTDIPNWFQRSLQRNVNSAVTGSADTNWSMVGSGYLAPMAAGVDRQARDKDEKYGEVLDSAAAASPVEVQKQIVGTGTIDKRQRNVVNTWKNAVNETSQLARERVASRSNPDQGRDIYVMATVGPDNRLQYIEYTAVLGTDPDTGEDVWRVQGTRPLPGLSEGVNRLANRYGVGKGQSRSVMGHPQINQQQFAGMSEEDYVMSVQDRINNNRDVPEWLTGQFGTGVQRTPNQEDIAGGPIDAATSALGIDDGVVPLSTIISAGTAIPRAVGRFIADNVSASEGTQRRREEALSRISGEPDLPSGEVTVARIKNAVRDMEAGKEQDPANRALATIFATPNAEDLGVTQEQLNNMSDEERYRLVADSINSRVQQQQ
jgi:hypothetical protein